MSLANVFIPAPVCAACNLARLGASRLMQSQSAVYPSLAGRTVFITGGGSGIGASLTKAFARQKANVAFVDVARDASRQVVDEVRQSVGAEPLFLECDLRDLDA